MLCTIFLDKIDNTRALAFIRRLPSCTNDNSQVLPPTKECPPRQISHSCPASPSRAVLLRISRGTPQPRNKNNNNSIAAPKGSYGARSKAKRTQINSIICTPRIAAQQARASQVKNEEEKMASTRVIERIVVCGNRSRRLLKRARGCSSGS